MSMNIHVMYTSSFMSSLASDSSTAEAFVKTSLDGVEEDETS